MREYPAVRALRRFAVLLLAIVPCVPTQPIVGANTLAIRDVTIVDPASGRARPSMTIVIEGSRVASVTPVTEPPPAGSTVIDGTGRYAIPGLWDMHTHYAATPGAREFMNPLWILNGTTGIRNLGLDPLNRVLEQRDLNESGRAAGPRIVTSGQLLDGPFPTWPFGVAVRSPEDARRLVDEQHASHADFIKVYGLLSREAFFAIVDQAKLRKIPVTGHVPLAVTAIEASNAGMKSMEHLYAVLYDASSHGADLNRRSAANAQRFTDERSRAPKDPHLDQLVPFIQMEIEAAQTYDARSAAQLFATLKKNGTWQVPTLVAKREWAYDDDVSYTSDKRNQLLPNDRPRFVSTLLKPEEMAAFKKAIGQELPIVRDLHRAGVGLLAGTDGLPFWLVDELEMFVKAGLSPAEALKTATINPAIFLGRENDFGSIDKGRLADLVLLDANPLQDIGSLRRIHAVIFNGRLYSRTDLDAMLTDVTTRAAAARAKR